ncbi:sensor histidine kinase [Humidesulfovibrio sp.]
MSAPAYTVTSPLTTRLLRRILLLSLILIFVLASVRAWWEYDRKLAEADALLVSIESTQAKPLASSLWDVDTDQVGLQLESMLSMPSIVYVAVFEHGRLVEERGVRQSLNVMERQVALTREHEGRTLQLGRLELQTDLSLPRSQALRAAGISLSLSAVMAAVVSGAIFLLMRSMVSRHLAAAAEHFQSLRVSPAGGALPALRLEKRWAGDELDILALAVNRMQENLVSIYAQATQAERQAKSLARFPEENPNPVLRVDVDGLLRYANKASLGFLAKTECSPGQPLPEPYRGIIRTATATGQVQQFEIEYERRTYAFAVRPVQPEGYVNLYGMDITQRKEVSDAIRRSLHEKEILLKEIHHRVKNNLQIISSLLFLQMEYVSLPKDKELFSESQKRIQAMALVHEELYGTEDLSCVNMPDYVPRLVERVLAGADIPVRHECQVDEVRLPVTRSIPCGLILNELVMNAVKHAFRPDGPAGGCGHLRVSLRREGLHLALEVEDNGPGLPPDFDINDTPTLGMTLVASLTQQLSGQVSAGSGISGALFRLVIPVEAA